MIHFVHIPKTGGTALAAALGNRVYRPGHHLRLSMVPSDEAAITILRDPVERYISAFGHMPNGELSSPEEMALALDAPIDHDVYRPQSYWIDSDHPLAWVGFTETLDQDVRALEDIVGAHLELPKSGYARNAGPPHQPLSYAAEEIVRLWYADDYELLERLR